MGLFLKGGSDLKAQQHCSSRSLLFELGVGRGQYYPCPALNCFSGAHKNTNWLGLARDHYNQNNLNASLFFYLASVFSFFLSFSVSFSLPVYLFHLYLFIFLISLESCHYNQHNSNTSFFFCSDRCFIFFFFILIVASYQSSSNHAISHTINISIIIFRFTLLHTFPSAAFLVFLSIFLLSSLFSFYHSFPFIFSLVL